MMITDLSIHKILISMMGIHMNENETRIIIAGGRDFNDYSLLKKSVEKIISDRNISLDSIEIVSGNARGADRLGERFAKETGLKVKTFPADWNRLGKRAGYVRNADMAKYASEHDGIGMLVAFWDGKSRGTKHMIDLANRYNLDVHVITY